MAVITSEVHTTPAIPQDRQPGLLADFGGFWHRFFARAFDPYRPELHYMRGPGPACRAKQTAASQLPAR